MKIEDAGITVVAISYDSIDVLSEFAESKELSFPLLSDTDSEVISAYGIKNERARGRQEGIPHPTTFVVDTDLKIVARLDGTVPRRHTTEQLLEAVESDE